MGDTCGCNITPGNERLVITSYSIHYTKLYDTESFIRSGHPLAADVILSMISLDYDDTLMAAAGHQAEEILEQTIEKYDGNFILARNNFV